MSNNFALDKFRFFEYGKPAPKGSRFKGIMNEEALTGYFDYTNKEDKNEKAREIKNLKKGGYLGYVNKDEYTFISEDDGWLNEKNKKAFEENLTSSFSNDGDLWWETIISFRNEESANEFGLENVEDFKALVERCMPKICKMMKIDNDNVIWWANRHIDTTHTHVHLNWIQKEKQRTEGKVSKSELKRLKNIIAHELIKMKEMKEGIANEFKIKIFKEKDAAYHELIEAIGKGAFSKEINSIEQLYSILPKTGRLSYNSKAMKPYKASIDKIIKNIIQDKEFKAYFDEYIVLLEKLNKYQNRFLSSGGELDIATLRDTEMKKLYSRIGNMIIKNFKKKTVVKYKVASTKAVFNDEIIQKMEQVPPKELVPSVMKVFTINSSLLMNEDERHIFVRIPGTHATKYMYLDKKMFTQIDEKTSRYVIDINKYVKIYDKHGTEIEQVSGKDLMEYWEDKTDVNIMDNQNDKQKITKLQMEKEMNEEKIFRKRKTIGYYKKRIRRWQKFRCLGISDSELYRELREWEKANGIHT